MKKVYTKQKNQAFKIPKTTTNKYSLNSSANGTKKTKTKNDTINKETVEGSCLDTQTLWINQDSLNNSKTTISKNYSLGKLDNKLILYTCSIKDCFNRKNKSTKFPKKVRDKNEKDYSNNIKNRYDEESDKEEVYKKFIENKECDEYTDEDTSKIDYRYYPKIPEIEPNKDKDNKYYWLATYDKLMKKSKIVKILNYYADSLSQKDSEIFIIEDANSDYNEEENKQRLKLMNEKYNFKEKSMIIQGYELYFIKKHGKPFVRQKKGGKLFIKLYLLNLEQINQIFSYINRLEYKNYIDNLDCFTQKNTFKIMHNFNKTIYNYSKVFFLGTFMNINIYLFSHTPKNDNDNNNLTYSISDLPSANKIAKIIKALMISFPDFSKKYFIDYLMKPKIINNEMSSHDKEILEQKMGEVDSLLMSNEKKNFKNYKVNSNINTSTNNVIKNIVNGIPTQTISSSNSQNNLNLITNNSFKTNSVFRNIEKSSSINLNMNKELNCSNFLSNIKMEEDSNSNGSKEKSNIKSHITNKEYKKLRTKRINQIKLNNISFWNNSNKSSSKSIYSTKKKVFKRPNICKTISLQNSKKCLTRNNSNNNNNRILKTTNCTMKNDEKDLLYNKENSSGFLNKNLINEYSEEKKDMIYYKNNNVKANSILKKSKTRNNLKIALNKSSMYTPFHTNTNSMNTEIETLKNNNVVIKSKKPIRILSTIKKVISQNINNVSSNTNSNNIYEFESNNSFKEVNNLRYYNENSRNDISSIKYNKYVCRTNNNSQNKQVEYITPLKKKFLYYYK